MSTGLRIFYSAVLLLPGLLYCAFAQSASVEFSLKDLHGKTHTIEKYAGKWVVVNYWATWCPPCLDEIPELVEFHDKHKDKDAVVLGVDFEEVDDKYLRRFVDENFISYPILKSRPSSRTPFGMIHGLPTTFLISPDGKVIASKTGGVTKQDLEESIEYFKRQELEANNVKK